MEIFYYENQCGKVDAHVLEELSVSSLFDQPKTLAASIFSGKCYPWEILPDLSAFICALGPTLDPERFEHAGEFIWIARSAQVAASASLAGPLIIDEDAQIRHCAFIRGSAVVGKEAVVGNSTELKNALLFDRVQVPHYNYVGDSVLGYCAHMGAGAITSNVKSDKSQVCISAAGQKIDTGRKKVGAMLGNHVEVGCGSVLNPGSVIGKYSRIYPLCVVRGFIPPNHIYKNTGELAEQR